MYTNIGGKIKTSAMLLFALGSFVSVIEGVLLWYDTGNAMWGGLILCGPATAWLLSLPLYGFGELIDKTCEISLKICGTKEKTEVQSKGESLAKHIIKGEEKERERVGQETDGEKIIHCPECGQELYFYGDTLNAKCPYCECDIKLNR